MFWILDMFCWPCDRLSRGMRWGIGFSKFPGSFPRGAKHGMPRNSRGVHTLGAHMRMCAHAYVCAHAHVYAPAYVCAQRMRAYMCTCAHMRMCARMPCVRTGACVRTCACVRPTKISWEVSGGLVNKCFIKNSFLA